MELICNQCQSTFIRNDSKTTTNSFCSRSCSAKFNNKRRKPRSIESRNKTRQSVTAAINSGILNPPIGGGRKKIIKTIRSCNECGTPTTNNKFCSRNCSALYARSHKHATPRLYGGPCPNCDNTMPFKRSKFCSNKCGTQVKRNKKYILVKQNFPSNWKTIRAFLIETVGKCQKCGIQSWMDDPITLECDHIDGDITNNVLSNARLLCPNCHSQTDTFRAKNMTNPNGREQRRKRYYKSQRNVLNLSAPDRTRTCIRAE
jgi:DNA-directed RNA polymerase subunit M/transcription elongation factor TFIIS